MSSPDTARTASRLIGVNVRSADPERDQRVFSAITGTRPTHLGGSPVGGPDVSEFTLGDAFLRLTYHEPSDRTPTKGIERIIFGVGDLEAAVQQLALAKAAIEGRSDDAIVVDPTWAGMRVELRQSAPPREPRNPGPGAAGLDHVAVLVDDIDTMAVRWTAMLGSPPDTFGVHPLGTAVAARFILGSRMIELVAPLPDRDSPLRARLDRVGEGPYALAIIATDLAATTEAVVASGARLLDQPPHTVVHPSDASGVPIQLTPRVHH